MMNSPRDSHSPHATGPSRRTRRSRSTPITSVLPAEALERRVLLAAQVTAILAPRIDPGPAVQTLFAPGLSQFSVPAQFGEARRYYRFASDAPGPVGATFSTSP